jgi:hypothetical protein
MLRRREEGWLGPGGVGWSMSRGDVVCARGASPPPTHPALRPTPTPIHTSHLVEVPVKSVFVIDDGCYAADHQAAAAPALAVPRPAGGVRGGGGGGGGDWHGRTALCCHQAATRPPTPPPPPAAARQLPCHPSDPASRAGTCTPRASTAAPRPPRACTPRASVAWGCRLQQAQPRSRQGVPVIRTSVAMQRALQVDGQPACALVVGG